MDPEQRTHHPPSRESVAPDMVPHKLPHVGCPCALYAALVRVLHPGGGGGELEPTGMRSHARRAGGCPEDAPIGGADEGPYEHAELARLKALHQERRNRRGE